MLKFTLRQLEYFVAVGDCGSIAQAAGALNVSSPSISAAIAQLEAAFGLQMFVRQHAQGLVPTPAGRRMLEQAKCVLAEGSTLVDLAGDISGTLRGPLSIGCLVTIAQVVVPTVRRAFEVDHPDVKIRQFELNQVELFSGLRRAEIDIALSYNLDVPADLDFTPLLELPPMAVFGVDHPLAMRETVTIEELQPYPMVLIDLPVSADYFMAFFSKIGCKPIIAERTRDMAVMRSMVGSGFGYSIANLRPMTNQSPDGKELRFVPLGGDAKPLQLGLLTGGPARNSAMVRAFVDHCKEQTRQGVLPALLGLG
jgi:DNA-binding transcriptional LysR family regulator